MKSYTLRFRAVDRANYEQVRDGSKSIETRAATTKYQPIAVGDELVFVCGEERFSKKITKKEHFASVDAMVRHVPFNTIMPSVKSVEEMKKRYASYPGYDEKIKELGIFAFTLK